MELTQISTKRKILLLVGVGLGILLAALDSTIVTTAMPKIIASLNGFEYYTWPLISYMLCLTIAMPLFGKLADTFGSKPIYLFGIIVFLIGSALCGFAGNMLQLAIYRGIQGIGGAILLANTLVIIGILFAPAERAKYVGIVGSASALASIAGPAVGGYITDTLGWHWVFFVNIPIGVIALVILFFAFPKTQLAKEKKRIDFLGAVTLVVALVPLLLAFTWAGSKYAWGSIQIIGMLVVSVMLLIAFIIIERKADDPIIPLKIFKTAVFNYSAIEMFLVNIVLMGATIYLPLFVQSVIGTSASRSGAIMTPMMLALICGTIGSGVIISKTGKYKMQTIIGLALSVIGSALLSFLSATSGNAQIIVSMVVLGFGMGIAIPIFTTSAQNAFSENELGVVTSGVQFFKYIGSTIGSAVLGTIMSSSLANGIRGVDFSILPESIARTLKDPSVLQNKDAIAQIQANIPAEIMTEFEKVITQTKQVLSHSIHEVFIVCIIIAAVSLVISLFMKEIILAKKTKS